MASKLKLLWLTFAFLALIHLKPSSTQFSHHEQPALGSSQLQLVEPNRKNITSRDTDRTTNNFILVTNGDQIKLYPIYDQHHTIALSDYHYLLKLRQFNTDINNIPTPHNNDYHELNQTGTNILTNKWPIRKKTQDTKRKSILPSEADQLGGDYNESSLDKAINSSSTKNSRDRIWKKPWISEVDFLLDRRFCSDKDKILSDKDCLFVVWLDRKNQFVRMASMNLLENPIRNSNFLKRSKTLFMDELPAIDVVNMARMYTVFNHSEHNYQVQSMSLSRSGQLSLIVQGLTWNRKYILTTTLTATHDGSLEQWSFSMIESRSSCCDELDSNQCDLPIKRATAREAKNLISLNGGDLLLWIEEGSSDIFLASSSDDLLSNSELSLSSTRISLAYNNGSILERVTRFIGMSKFGRERNNLTALSADESNIYFMDCESKIFGFLSRSQEVQLIGQLTEKFSSRAPFYMQKFKNYFIISEPNKKTLVSFNITNGQSEIILVEMNAVYGFKVVDTSFEELKDGEQQQPDEPTQEDIDASIQSMIANLKADSYYLRQELFQCFSKKRLVMILLYMVASTFLAALTFLFLFIYLKFALLIVFKKFELIKSKDSSAKGGFERILP